MRFLVRSCLTIYFLVGYINPAIAASQKQRNEHECPAGIEQALKYAKLVPLGKNGKSIGPGCTEIEKFSYGGSEAKIINAMYGVVYGIDPSYLSIPILVLPGGALYVLPGDFTRSWDLQTFLTHQLETPFGSSKLDANWSNILINDVSDRYLIKKGDSYCIKYDFKFPFTGQIQQCANPQAIQDRWKSAPYFISGTVVYQQGVFHWKDALERVLQECPKYHNSQCKCCIGGWNGVVPTAYWGSQASIAMKISNEPTPHIEYYLFVERLYRGEEEDMLIQVFPDGEVRSRLTGGTYNPQKLIQLANEPTPWQYISRKNIP